MLTHFWIIFFKLEFTSTGTSVLAGGVKIAGSCGAFELDLFALWLSHDISPLVLNCGTLNLWSSIGELIFYLYLFEAKPFTR